MKNFGMSRSSAAVLPGVVAAILTCPSLAVAVETAVTLVVDRPEGTESCASAEQLRRAVEQRLDRRVFVREPAWGSVSVRYERTPGGLVAHVTLRDAEGLSLGERELKSEGKGCSELDEVLALVIALLVDEPLRIAARQEANEAGAQPPSTEPGTPVSSSSGWIFEPGARLIVSAGLLPGFAVGVRPRFGVLPPGFWPVFVDATAYFEAREHWNAVGSVFAHWNVGLGVCPSLSLSTWAELYGCPVFRFGATSVEGFGFDKNRSASRLLPMVSLEFGAALQVADPLWLEVGLEGGVPLQRDRFVFTSDDGATIELYRPDAVSIHGMIGAAIRF